MNSLLTTDVPLFTNPRTIRSKGRPAALFTCAHCVSENLAMMRRRLSHPQFLRERYRREKKGWAHFPDPDVRPWKFELLEG